MLIFVYGADTFRARAKVRELVLAFKKKHDPAGLNTSRHDAAKTTPDELRAAFSTPGFLSKRRLVVLDGFLGVKRTKEELEDAITLLKSHAPETVVVLADDLPADKAATNAIVKAFMGRPTSEVVSYPFAPLPPRDLRKWLQDEAKRRAIIIEPQAFELLAAAGNDLWRQTSNMDKLAAYAAGRPVLPRDVELLVRRPVEENIFACMDAVAEQNLPRAAALIRTERAAGVEDAFLFSMLVRQFRLILLVHSRTQSTGPASAGALGKELGLNPFVAGKALAQSRGTTADVLRSRFLKLCAMDQEIKTGRISYGSAVDYFLASLTTASA